MSNIIITKSKQLLLSIIQITERDGMMNRLQRAEKSLTKQQFYKIHGETNQLIPPPTKITLRVSVHKVIL